MKRIFVPYIQLVLLLLLLSCSTFDRPNNPETPSLFRSYYDTLPLDLAEQTTRKFVQAFQEHDFVTVYMMLAPIIQQRLTNNPMTLFDSIILEESFEKNEALQLVWHDRLLKDNEHFMDTLNLFDAMMLTAAQHSALSAHLPGELTILSANETRLQTGHTAIEIVTSFTEIEEPIVFRLVRSPRGKWRVFQVVWPDGNQERYPWALPATSHKTESPTPATIPLHSTSERIFYDTLALDTPHQAVLSFVEAFQHQDFYTVFLILDREAQMEWRNHFIGMKSEKLTKVSNWRFLIQQTDFGRSVSALEEAGDIESGAFLQVTSELTGVYRNSPHTPLAVEHIGDTAYLFDQIMVAADGQYLIDLRQEIALRETRLRELANGEKTAIVTAQAEGTSGELFFRLRLSPARRWRVLQVVTPGGNENSYPWATFTP
jgi:hypothetical protein